MAANCAVGHQGGHLSVMWKTVSEACNLACDYCYYSTCGGKPDKINRIDPQVLETFIADYMAHTSGSASFAWQGGEPLLAGIDFFREVVRLQAKYAPPNTTISNAIQTNGTLINDEWARLFKEYRFLVGVSLDGPEHIHNARRVNAAGQGSYDRVMRGIGHLRRHQVDFNILSVLHEGNVRRAQEMMDFYRTEGFTHVQFIPCMDFRSQETGKAPDFHITPEQYGQFLCELFDIWYNGGNPQFSERFFDTLLDQTLGREAGLCIHSSSCPRTLILEQNGDAYPCDFYISEDYKLGNVGRDALEDILRSPVYTRFLSQKPSLPESCKSCEYLSLCHGGCPRNRRWDTREDYIYPDYFCQSYKMIYAHSAAGMKRLAGSVRRFWLEEYRKTGLALPGRNDPCFCGSGRKYKACCQTAV
ncbi:anaerobic sulfatase maturase [Paenibacillus sp. S150]|uniref:anaerobic sulfatase maturase n=1 Tax=Paenibacillus sp. S150 TaxID=2749826 RepID=UPI001C566425|nr:anaerobic sulfatase maturase [Paenibacillus sp. S150]MBW4084321.1 anaerobic sulfatase maturase [Paenibacillus sp. S150]